MEDKAQKAASIIELSSTGSRSQTVSSLLENILYLYNEMLTAEQIAASAQEIFGVVLSLDEINTTLAFLVQHNRISARGEKYVVTDDCYNGISARQQSLAGFSQNRISSFSQIIKNHAPDASADTIKELWALFNAYICRSLHKFGKNILPQDSQADLAKTGYLLESELIRFFAAKVENTAHRDLFITSCREYVSSLDQAALNYYQTLAQNVAFFYALVFPAFWDKEANWVIFADAGFIGSALSLDKGPETLACKALVNLAKHHPQRIRIKFLPITLTELSGKQQYYDTLIPANTLHEKLVKAMLDAGGLDPVSKAWYEQFLNDASTSHPSQIIAGAEKTLIQEHGFEKFNYRFETVFSEEYMSSAISEYKKHISLNNSSRVVNGWPALKRTNEKLQHDAFLCEAIDRLREENAGNSTTYIGLTTDEALLNYCKQQDKESLMPRFLSPAFLMNILSGCSNEPGTESKNVLLTALFSFPVEENMKGAEELRGFVSYYLKRGLSDDKLLLSFISDKTFLKTFYQKDEGEKSVYFESELNNRAHDAGYKAEELMSHLNEVMNELARTKQDASSNEEKIKQQENEILALKEKQSSFENELNRLVLEKQQELEIIRQPLIKHPAETAGDANPQTRGEVSAGYEGEKNKPQRRIGRVMMVVSCAVGVVLLCGFVYFGFIGATNNKMAVSGTEKQTPAVKEIVPAKNIAATVAGAANTGDGKSTKPAKPTMLLAAKATTHPATVTSTQVKTNTPPISESKVRSDMVGIRLTGCDITIKSPAEISALGNLVLVEKLSSGTLKYKFTAKISQGKESYSANPYIYYAADGTFIKVDGTNCE